GLGDRQRRGDARVARHRVWLVAAMLVALVGMMAGLAAAKSGAEGHGSSAGLHVEWAWARPGITGGTSAVYMNLVHHGEEPLNVIGAEAEVAATVELHETILSTEGATGAGRQTMRMVRVPSIPIAPGETVEFAPGGLHVMLIGLRQRLAEGDEVELRL